MIEFLLNQNAPYDLGKPGSAHVWVAAYMGHAEAVDVLLTRFGSKHNAEEKSRFLEKRPGPESGHSTIYAAASSGKPAVMRVLLGHGAKYIANWFDATPLMATASFRCPDVTRVLLEYQKQKRIDVEINRRAKNGRTALVEACANNQAEVAEMILDAGADYMIVTNPRKSALHLACGHDNVALVRMLLEKAYRDPDRARFLRFINARAVNGQTVLLQCAERGKLQHVKLLLDFGADYTVPGHAGNNPTHWAALHGHDEVLDTILKKAKEDWKDEPSRLNDFLNRKNKNESRNPLLWTVEYNKVSTFKLLLETYHSDYSVSNHHLVSSLHAASFLGWAGIISALLEYASKDADHQKFHSALNARNDQGKTPLMDATHAAHPNIVRMLLDHGADIHIRDNEDFNVLHYAAFRHRHNCLKMVLDRGVGARDVDGGSTATRERYAAWTNQRSSKNRASPLRDATMQGHVNIVKILFEYGADFEIYDFREKLQCITLLSKGICRSSTCSSTLSWLLRLRITRNSPPSTSRRWITNNSEKCGGS